MNEQHGDSQATSHEAAGCYAVDALSDTERAEFEDHLSHCESCTREVAEFAESLAELSHLGAVPPPPELRQSVLAAIAENAPLPVERPEAAPTDTPAAGPRHAVRSGLPLGSGEVGAGANDAQRLRPARRGFQRAVSLALAAAVVVALALGGWVVRLNQQHQTQQAQAAAVARLMSAPDVKVYPVTLREGVRGSYTVSQSLDQGLFTATSVPAVDKPHTYQMWTVHNGQARPSGSFAGGQTVRAWLNGVRGADQLAITIEDEPDATTPTPPLLAPAKI